MPKCLNIKKVHKCAKIMFKKFVNTKKNGLSIETSFEFNFE